MDFGPRFDAVLEALDTEDCSAGKLSELFDRIVIDGIRNDRVEMWEDDKVFGISDMHVDMAVNFAWLHNLPTRPRDILIVAGDLCTGLTTLRKALALLVAKFRVVFFVPGNHELWTYRGGPNSIRKFFEILKICEEMGVRTTATLLGDSAAIVPLQGWYCQDVNAPRSMPFDQNCSWPPYIGDPKDEHNSSYPGISEFFLSLNNQALKFDYSGRYVISFAHFVPLIKFCVDVPEELVAVLCCLPNSSEVNHISSRCHVFGHSHININVVIEGTRFIQNALGHPKDKITGIQPLMLWQNFDCLASTSAQIHSTVESLKLDVRAGTDDKKPCTTEGDEHHIPGCQDFARVSAIKIENIDKCNKYLNVNPNQDQHLGISSQTITS